MRRLVFLFTALVLALGAQRISAHADELAAYLVRDSLLLSAAAAVLFALNATPLPVLQRTDKSTASARPTTFMALLVGTGLLCALAGGWLLAQDVQNALLEPFRLTLWLIGLGLFVVGALWPVPTRPGRPPFRWRRTADGAFERMAADAAAYQNNATPEATADRTYGDLLARGQAVTLLVIILLVAMLLRVWTVWTLSPDCIGAECMRLLQDVDSTDSLQPAEIGLMLNVLLQFTTHWIDPSVRALRLVGVLLGTLTVLAFFALARQMVHASGALAAAALLAVNVWHMQSSVLLEPYSMLPLLISASGWTALCAYRRGNLRWLAAASMAWGLLLIDAGPLRLATVAWLLVAGGIGIFALPAEHLAWRTARIVTWIFGALALAAPWLLSASFFTSSSVAVSRFSAAFVSDVWQVVTALLLPGHAAGLLETSGTPPLGMLEAALFILGVGVLLRTVRQPAALLVLSNLVLGVVAVVLVVANFAAAETTLQNVALLSNLLLVLLPALFVGMAVALDQLISCFQQTWRVLVPPVRVAAAMLAVLLVLAAPSALREADRVGAVPASADSGLATAAGRYLAEQLTADANNATGATYFVPPTLLADPALRASAGSALDGAQEAGRVQAFEPMTDLFFADAPTDRVYLIPGNEQRLLEFLTQLYPQGAIEPQRATDSEALLFTTFHVALSDVQSSHALRAFYFAGDEIESALQAAATERSPSLQFNWDAQPPLEPPFSARWEGSLLVPEAGHYTFFIQPTGNSELFDSNADDEANAPQNSLRLDGRLVLDTTAGLREQRISLARGPYHVDLRYHSGAAPAGFSIRWQRPDGRTESVPTELLHSPPIPDNGLLGTYFAGEQFSGPPLLHQKDLLIDMDVDVPRPYSVRWRGKMAASRAGEYLLGAATAGRVALRVNGHLLVDLPDASLRENDIGYREGLLYLERGWHDIEIEYVPVAEPNRDGSASLQLFWHPPGSAPDRLSSRYLAPITEQTGHAARPLPTASELTDTRLGDADFALTQAPAFRNPQVIVPPDTLSPLSAQPVWQLDNGCGADVGQFNAPRGVAIDAEAELIYVADTGNRRIAAYDLEGNFVRGLDSEQFQEPFDVAILPESSSEHSTLLVLDSVAQQIWRIPAATDTPAPPVTALPLETSFYRPRGFDVDAAGNLFVADTGGGRVVALSAEGQVVATIGGSDTLLGRGQPVDAALINGQLWAVTAEDGRLWRLQESVVSINGSMTAVQPTNTFDAPHFAALPDGRFFLSDPLRSRVLLHAQSGQPLRQLVAPDALQRPVGIAAAVRDGRTVLAVADSAACRVSLWDVNS